MIKVTREEPAEPLVTITTTQYGAEFIAYCLRCYGNDRVGDEAVVSARAARAISNKSFAFDLDKISKLFK